MITVFQRVREWFFTPREWNLKTYATINRQSPVRIYEKSTSPWIKTVKWIIATLIFAFCGAVIYAMIFVSPPSGVVEWVFYAVPFCFVALPPLITLLVIDGQVQKWYERHFTTTTCDYCSSPTTYPHVFDEHYDVASHHIHEFCSTDCRMAWERENVEYDFSGYYDIQSKEGKHRVEHDHYTSAYNVEGPEAEA